MISTSEALNRLIDKNELFYDEMTDLMRRIMRGEVAPEVMAAILIGLRIKVETVLEITAAANVMREFAIKVPVENKKHLVDIVGTGGDNAHTFNISTTSMFVAAAMGAHVAKHGGRSVSSKSGAADVMEYMGAPIDLSAQSVGKSIDQIGLGFMFAPNHHIAMKYVAPVRRALGVRTIFNILGPLTNPADAPRQLLGVFHPDLVGICSRVSQQMGMRHMMVVNGKDGLDEITISAPTLVAELKDGWVKEYEICPEDFGLQRSESLKSIQVDSAQNSLKMMNGVLAGEKGAHRDIVLLNAGATLYCANVVSSLADGVQAAIESIDSGKAKAKQNEYIAFAKQQSENA